MIKALYEEIINFKYLGTSLLKTDAKFSKFMQIHK